MKALRISGTIVGLTVLASASCGNPAPPAPPPAPASLETVAPEFKVVAADFLEEFRAGEPAAMARYRDKVVEVTGIFFTWTLVKRPGGGEAASDITLVAGTGDAKIFFVLDREVMDKRYLIIDYWSRIRMKGRFKGKRDDGSFLFADSVLTSTFVTAKNYPAAASVSPADLAAAFWPPDDTGERSRPYLGRVIEVEGMLESAVEGSEPTMATGAQDRPLRLHFAGGDGDLQGIDRSKPVKVRGFCAGHVAGTTGVTLENCAVVGGP